MAFHRTAADGLIPLIRSIESHLSFKYASIVADVGYESEENYLFLEENGQMAFIKYSCSDCSGCSKKETCIKGNNCKTPMEERTKNFEVSKKFIEQRKACLKRIISKEGCQLRMNRSIQAEESFSELKDGMGFRRYLSRGKKNVLAESILPAMALNLNKFHVKIQSGRTGTHLFKLKTA